MNKMRSSRAVRTMLAFETSLIAFLIGCNRVLDDLEVMASLIVDEEFEESLGLVEEETEDEE